MTLRDAWPALAALLAAGVPAALLATWRTLPEPRPTRLPGRFFLLFGASYAALLVLYDRIGPAPALLAIGLWWGFLGGGRGAVTLHRLLYGARWLADHPEAPRAAARRWQLPLMIGAVACFAAAMALGR